jgi:hypothetical protein
MQLKLGQLFVYALVVCPPMACSSGGQSGGGDVTGAAGAATAGTTGAAGATSAAGTAGSTGAGGAGSDATGSAGTGGTASGGAGAGTTGGAGAGGKKTDADGGGSGGIAVISPPSSTDAGVRAEAAHIRETASTNTPEINVSVYADGSAERKVGAGNVPYVADKSYPANAPEVLAFLADLHTVGDVSKIPTASDCLKSASFGTRTIVSADGVSSGDVQCLLATATDADVQLALDARRLDGTIQ